MSFINRLIQLKGKPVIYRSHHAVPIKDIASSPDLCSKCGGQCCKNNGCHFSPEDFMDLSFEGLKKEIDKGYISIIPIPAKLYSLPYDIYILKIRNKKDKIITSGIYPEGAEHTGCGLLSDEGCLLPYDNRPTGGKSLIALPNNKCIQEYDLRDCAREWQYYQEVVRQLVAYYSELEKTAEIPNQLADEYMQRKNSL